MEQQSKQHLKVLVIGRSGSGKTTLINCMVNHFFNKNYDEDRLIAITQNLSLKNLVTGEAVPVQMPCNIPNFENKQSDGSSSQSRSQTSKPNIYDFENAYMKLSIVDTPGLGDTGGMEVDTTHSENICQAAASLTDFNAIVFVHRAGDCRADVMLSYMIREFQGILPKDCSDNFIVCFTGAPNPKKIDGLAALKEMKIPTNKYFTFENDYLIPKHLWLEKTGVGSDPALQAKYQSTLRKMGDFWEEAKDIFDSLFDHIKSLIPQPGKSLLEMSLKRQIIRKLISENSDKFTAVQMRMSRLDHRQKELADLKTKLTDNQDYETTEYKLVKKVRYHPQTKMEEQDISPEKITQCLVCKNLCHDPCHLDHVCVKGQINLQQCAALGGTDTCIRPECLHSREDHWHTHLKMMEVTEQIPEEYMEMDNVVEIDADKQASYIHASQQIPQIDAMVQDLQNEVAVAQQELSAIYRQIAYLHSQLDKESQFVRNEFFGEYLEYKRTMLFSNAKLTEEEKQQEMAFLKKADSDYQSLKHVIEAGPAADTQSQDDLVFGAQFGVLLDSLETTIRSYQGDRRAYVLTGADNNPFLA